MLAAVFFPSLFTAAGTLASRQRSTVFKTQTFFTLPRERDISCRLQTPSEPR